MGQHKTKLPMMKYGVLTRTDLKLLKKNKYHVDMLINTDEYESVTALWLAVRYGDVNFASKLLSVGADPNKCCGGIDMTPLHMAAYTRNTSITVLLLSNGANPNVLDRWNYTPLMYLAVHYDAYVVEEMFKILIRNSADVNFGATMMNDDIQNEGDREKYSSELPSLRSGYDSDYITHVTEPMGATSGGPLHLAVQNPHLPNETIEILLSAGANLDLPNLHHQSPLMGVMMDTYYDYHSNVQNHAELLLQRGADVNAIDIRGWNCFHYAAQRGSIPCMELLMTAGVNCEIVSKSDESPLWMLLVLGWREGASYLIRSGCGVNFPVKSTTILEINQSCDICRYGYILPIEFAVCNKYYKVAEMLVKTGCKIDENTFLGNHTEQPNIKHTEFLNFLKEFSDEQELVQSLRHLCRITIRGTMQNGICTKVKQLNVPNVIAEYICLEH